MECFAYIHLLLCESWHESGWKLQWHAWLLDGLGMTVAYANFLFFWGVE